MIRYESLCIQRPFMKGHNIPQPFERGEVIKGILPHDGHSGDMRVREKDNKFIPPSEDSHIRTLMMQAILVCNDDNCDVTVLATAVTSDMSKPGILLPNRYANETDTVVVLANAPSSVPAA